MLNMDGKPNATSLIWEHIEDAPGRRCPHPRVVMPRRIVPDVVNEPVSVDIRSFRICTPICNRSQASYGSLGLFHVLSSALAWLWRLVAPRGHDNPSISEARRVRRRKRWGFFFFLFLFLCALQTTHN